MTYPTLEAALAAHADDSFRVRQRICGLYLGSQQDSFTQKELRQLCKEHDACHTPTFSRSIKQDSDFFTGDKHAWSLTAKGRTEAEDFFGKGTVSADATPDAAPDLTDVQDAIAAIDDALGEPEHEPEPALPEPTFNDHEEEAHYLAAVDEDAADEAPVAPVEAQEEPVAALQASPAQPAPTAPYRAPRVRAANALASLFRKLENEKEGKGTSK